MEPLSVTVFGMDGRLLGIVVMVLATALLAGSGAWLAKVNPTDELPSGWGKPPVAPLGALLIRGAGAGLAILGVVLVAPGLGWTVVLILAMFVPYGAINVVHNGRVRRAADSPQ